MLLLTLKWFRLVSCRLPLRLPLVLQRHQPLDPDDRGDSQALRLYLNSRFKTLPPWTPYASQTYKADERTLINLQLRASW